MGRKTQTTLLVTLLAAAIGFGMPAMAQDYLKDGKANREMQPGEKHTKELGDSPDMFKPDPNNSGNDYQSKRLRAIAATDKKMDNWMNGPMTADEHGHKLTAESFAKLEEKAKAGDLPSILEVAEAYRDGNGTTKNDNQAVEWYKQSISKGHFESYSVIGDIYRDYGANASGGTTIGERLSKLTGSGDVEAQKDNAVAREWYQKGTVAGDPASYMQLGLMYRDGVGGVEKDPEMAAKLYNTGLAMRKELNEKRIAEQRRKFYLESARAEGLEEESAASDKVEPGQTDNTDAKAVGKTTISGADCVVTTSNAKQTGYAALFDAKCPSLVEGKEGVDVEISGFVCKVQPISGSLATHRLLCNPATPDVMIGEASCRLERAASGMAYNALCDRAVDSAVASVDHNGMTCAVKAGKSVQNPTLDCKPAITATSVSLSIGKHACALNPVDSPSSDYAVFYEGFCGGLSESDKAAAPKTLTVKDRKCDVSPWPVNTMGKDFDVRCK